MLLKRCKELLGAENLHVDRRFKRFEETEAGVTAHFTNRAGESFVFSGAALIGADDYGLGAWRCVPAQPTANSTASHPRDGGA